MGTSLGVPEPELLIRKAALLAGMQLPRTPVLSPRLGAARGKNGLAHTQRWARNGVAGVSDQPHLQKQEI